MKNLKVKKKLLLSFGIVLALLVLIAGLSASGISRLKGQMDTFLDETLSNTEYVWSMRRNLMSESRYLTMALLERSPNERSALLQKALNDVEKNIPIMDKYRQNHRIDPAKIDQLEDIIEREKAPRAQLHQIMQSNDPNASAEAYDLFSSDLQPLLYEHGVILREIDEAQIALTDQQIARSHTTYVGTLIFIAAILVVSIIISLMVIAKLTRAILSPLREIEQAANALAQGDFSVDITYESQDEFGQTCDLLQNSFTELKRVIGGIAHNLRQMADGDFALNTDMNFRGEMKEIEVAGVDLVNRINKLFHEIKVSAMQIRAGAEQMSNGSQALAQGATEQASSVEELSASITEISSHVYTNAENSQKASQLAANSGEVAELTLGDMQEMLSAMKKISQSSEHIEKVIKVLDDITFQTNILALNAAVEAARAGAAGKGFAVVADEVRTLAHKSSESAKEINELIANTIASVSQGEQIAQKTSQAFNSLTSQIREVISTVNEIASASEEQASSIAQVTVGVDQISAVVQTNSATSEESAAASEELSAQASVLNRLVSQFKVRDSVDTNSFQTPDSSQFESTPNQASFSASSGAGKYF